LPKGPDLWVPNPTFTGVRRSSTGVKVIVTGVDGLMKTVSWLPICSLGRAAIRPHPQRQKSKSRNRN